MTINWAILGHATIARICVIPAIQKSRNGRVHILATRNPQTAADTVARHHIPHVTADYEAAVHDPAVDAVYIPLPNHLHKPWALKALAAGKHVLIEKPIALNAAEAQEIFDTAAQHNLLAMEAFMYRFHPRTQRLKQAVDAGQLGQLRLIHAAFGATLDEGKFDQSNNIRLKPEWGGGALMDTGCYGVSLARWMAGTEPESVQAQALYYPNETNGVDVNFAGLLKFPNGLLATVEASFISALQQTFKLVGSDAAVELPHDAFIPWEKQTAYTLRIGHEERGRFIPTPAADEYQLMVEQFADAVLSQSQLPFTAQDSINNMRVLDALAQAAKSGESVKLKHL